MSFWKGCSSALARLSRPQSTTLLHHKSVLPTLYPYLSLHSKFHTSVSLHDAFKIPRPTPRSQPTQSSQSHQSPTAQSPQPAYELTFTCTPCTTRSTHRVSKQGYHHGSVLITCPECKNRHVISDHLKIFGDKSMNIEDLMREKGELVRKGSLSEDGDFEFWEGGQAAERKPKSSG